jgi:predicted restriction endonuclease
MIKLEFALRDEKINVFAMTHGGLNNQNSYQIFICKKEPITDRPYLLVCNKKTKYKLSKEGSFYLNKIKRVEFNHNYIAVIDCQIKIRITSKVFQELAKNNLFSVWEPSEPIKYFENMYQGYLVIFRVYKIDTSFELDDKTRMNPIFNIANNLKINLLRDKLDSISLQIPVLSDQQFIKIKSSLLEVLNANESILEIVPGESGSDTIVTHQIETTLNEIEDELEYSGEFNPSDINDARKRTMASIVRRRGQPAFRKALINAYEGKCSITGCDASDTLEAAHITPYMGDHTNTVQNGLLLRADIHTLFDIGKITISQSDFRVILHHDLREGYYKLLHGKLISMPKDKSAWPSKAALEMHKKASGL